MNNNYIVYLHSIWLTSKNLLKMYESNIDFEDFWNDLNSEKLKNLWIKEEKISKILELKNKFNKEQIDKILENIDIITYKDPNYPQILKNLYNPPFVIYIKWEYKEIPTISIVWTRRPTNYSEKILKKVIPDFVWNWLWTVSWWAYWVDTLVHKITLENNWYTTAVIWTWIDWCYPPTNKNLYTEIVEKNSCILSIFPIWTQPNNYNFPIRNEIIACLGNSLLVTEAWEKSGTLITAKLALDLGKDVFAVPGDIFKEQSSGINLLISNSMAKPVFWSEDILEEMKIEIKNKQKQEKIEIIFEDEIEQKIFNLLKEESLNWTDICQKLWIEIWEILYRLSMLEIWWYIRLENSWLYNII